MKHFNTKNKFVVIVIFIAIVFLICHVSQYEKFESRPDNSDPVVELFESEITEANKHKLMLDVADKLVILNKKIDELSEKRPVSVKTYNKLFEEQLPQLIDEERVKKQNVHLFDISQKIQNDRLKNIENKITSFVEKDPESFKETENQLKSIRSHEFGKNLNLIPNTNNTYSIPVNDGCLFVVNNDTGEVDYGITNMKRTDKNKVCLKGNQDQQFNLTKIENLTGYKAKVGDKYNFGLIDPNDVSYPFYMVSPKNNENLCLHIEHDSVHFEPCNLSRNQRWSGNTTHKPCTCK